MNSKLMGLLTICRKAGRTEMGFDPVKDAIKSGKAKAILVSSDISPKTEKEVRFFADKSGITVVKTDYTQEDFRNGIGKKVGVIAICDAGFAKRAIMIENEQ